MRNTKLYIVFLIFTIVCALGAVITLIPSAHDTELNVLGYKSMCSFAPWSTVTCLFLAGMSCTVRKKYFR